MSRVWFLHDEQRTRAAGAALAHALAPVLPTRPVIITLSGDLGAGKTTFAGGFLNALGVKGPVRSPTYTLLEPYELAAMTVLHMDLYRLTDPLQLEDLGLRDHLQAGSVFLVEWAERGGEFFARPDLGLMLSYAEQAGTEGRELRINASAGLAKLVDSLAF